MKDRGEQRPKRGLINTRRRDEIGRRRLSPAGLITFYDLGQIKSGPSWVQNDYLYDPEPGIIAGGASNDQLGFAAPLSLTQMRAFEHTILPHGLPSNAESYFRPWSSSTEGAFLINFNGYDSWTGSDTGEHWGPSGLTLSPSELGASVSFYVWHLFGFGAFSVTTLCHPLTYPDPSVKVTATYDFSAPPVTFNPGVSDKWFLMPILPLAQGGKDSLSLLVIESIKPNLFHAMVPRLFDEPNHAIQGFSSDARSFHTTRLPSFRTFTFHAEAPDISSPFDATLTAGGTFDAGKVTFETGPFSHFFLPNVNLPEVYNISGSLAAVCKQGSAVFYFWRV